MRLLPRYCIEHRAARAHRDGYSIRRENDSLFSIMAIGREQFVESDLHRLPGLLRPLSLGLIGLEVAVAIWGFAYKLSLYQPHLSHSAKASVVKLWLGPDGNSLTAKSPKSHLQPNGNLDLSFVPQNSIPLNTRGTIWSALGVVAVSKEIFTDSPPRSPPTEVI